MSEFGVNHSEKKSMFQAARRIFAFFCTRIVRLFWCMQYVNAWHSATTVCEEAC